MSSKPVRQPGPDHPITVSASAKHITIMIGDTVVADTRRALDLKEATYPVVHYIPRSDVHMALLERTPHSTYCPYKGDCAYYSIPAGGAKSTNAVWSYEHPYPAVAEIKDYLAFYPDRVQIREGSV
ncbi:MAG TPA: DUF427 domain-containing protein [Steroidobacteraceae bacterium]|jgi:uncharacterized protein (DUF427 family)